MGVDEKKEAGISRRGVLICGAYGHGNAGDEAILEAIIAEMRGIDPLMPLTVLSRRPDETGARFGVSALHTFDFFGFLRVMRRTKLYINGGGSLIQDVTSRRSLWYYLFTIAAAKILGNRVLMYGCGIGPVSRFYNRRLVRSVLNRYVDIITLREPNSLEELRDFGVIRPEVILSSDPALSLPAAEPEAVSAAMSALGLDPNGRYACFALRRWQGFNERAGEFSAAARYVYGKYGLTPLFLSINHRNDGDASELAAATLRDIPYHILRDPMETSLAIGLLSRMALVISMRLHGLIFAARAGTPAVGISYDPKVSAFLDYMGNELYVSLEDVEAGGLCSLIDSALTRDFDFERRQQLIGRERLNVEAARRLLGDIPTAPL